MNFYYHPILGLQYDNLGVVIILDIENIPREVDLNNALKNIQYAFSKIGVRLYDAQIHSEINFRG